MDYEKLDLSALDVESVFRMAHAASGHKDDDGSGQRDPGRERRVADKLETLREMSEIKTALEQRDVEIKRFCQEVVEGGRKTAQEVSGLKERIEKTATEGVELVRRFGVLEQKLTRINGAGGEVEASGAKTWGQQFTAKHEGKPFDRDSGRKWRAEMDTKTTATLTLGTTGAGGVGNMIRPERLPGVIVPPNRPLVIRDLLAPGRTNSNAIQYYRETAFSNNAAVVAETALKPQSDLTGGLVTVPVTTIAHWFLASIQVLDDVPMLESYIDSRARYGLAFAEEQELLLGDGTGAHLLGLMPQATAYSQSEAGISSVNRMDRIRNAMTQLMVTLYRPDAVVLHPADWGIMQLAKNSQGSYLWANPFAVGPSVLWGLPVAESMSMAAGSWLIGAFSSAAQIFDRQGVVVELSTEDSDNFRKNLVTIRAEERLALAVYRPGAFVTGTFALPTAV